ncbi:MAG: hypothetical protein ACO29O_04855, partial [Chitinophagaceae bacterium]
MGKYTSRNGAVFPWYNRLDFKLLQDIFTEVGKRRNTLQLSLDILNFANLLNKDWGILRQTTIRNPLIPAGVVNGKQTYRMTQLNKELPTQPYAPVISSASTWSLQIGFRYIF